MIVPNITQQYWQPPSIELPVLPHWAWMALCVILFAAGVLLLVLLSVMRRRRVKKREAGKRSIRASVQAMLTVQIASEQGDRNSQQDFCAFANEIDDDTLKRVGLLCVLCDGMGGLAGGEAASRCCAETMLSEFYRISPTNNQPDVLRQCAVLADQRVSALTGTARRLLHCGTTLVAVLVRGNTAYWISVGDSRIYVYQDEKLSCITQDHNYALYLQEQVSNGSISVEYALAQPKKDALVSFIGSGDLAWVDTGSIPFLMNSQNGILLCSDGVTKSLTDADMEAVARACPPEEFASALVDVAMQKDNRHDNTTALYISSRAIQ